jgi:hypothetical protein
VASGTVRQVKRAVAALEDVDGSHTPKARRDRSGGLGVSGGYFDAFAGAKLTTSGSMRSR